MDILNNTLLEKATSKPEMEMVEREKHEYKLVGTYLRRKGLRLFAYNSLKNELKEVAISTKDTINIISDENGQLTVIDTGYEEANVDTRNIHFEALNLKSAKKRLQKYKSGKIKELCNLREPGDGISFF
jgi:hypothetical protein